MKKINNYILEKFRISKDIIDLSKKEEINKKFISSIKAFMKERKNVDLDKQDWKNSISICGKNKDFILLTLKDNTWIYSSLKAFIDKNYDVRKPCASNHQSLYIYPNYENYN